MRKPTIRTSLLIAFSTLLLGLGLTAFDEVRQYRFPLDGFRSLSATFGELRGNHFHSGIDVKTGGVIGAPLYAIEDGYLFRIKISAYSYGNAVYLKHPDGNYSLYGHMSQFNKAIGDYVYQQQQKSESWVQELYPQADSIRVKRGEIIGYSGNSGGSFGPHLHFEIRDENHHVMNPLAFYPNEIPDHIAPIIQKLAFEPLDIDARINGAFDKYTFEPTGGDGGYYRKEVIELTGKVGLEYYAYDLLDAARNRCGINSAKLYLDESLVFEYDLQNFSFNDTRYINAHFDYATFIDEKRRYEKAYRDKGNRLPAYKNLVDDGVIELLDSRVHPLRLVLADHVGNTTTFEMKVRKGKDYQMPRKLPVFQGQSRLSYEVKRNVLSIQLSNPRAEHWEGLMFTNHYGLEQQLFPSYLVGNTLTYLLPLDEFTYPHAIWDKSELLYQDFHFQKEIRANRNNLLEVEDVQLFFPHGAVYQNEHLQVTTHHEGGKLRSKVYEIGDSHTPLHKAYKLGFQTPSVADSNELIIVQHTKKGWQYIGNQHEDGRIYATPKVLGKFALMKDGKGPELWLRNIKEKKRISKKTKYLHISAWDEISDVDPKSIHCTLDGDWVLFVYDYKADIMTHKLTKRPRRGRHKLRVSMKDYAGNETVKKYILLF